MRFSYVFSLIFKKWIFCRHISIWTKKLVVGYFKSQMSKCPDLCEILLPIFAHIMPYRPSTKQILYLMMYIEFPSIYLKCIECLWFSWITSYFLELPWLILYDPEIPRNTLNYIECLELPLFTINCLKCHALH